MLSCFTADVCCINESKNISTLFFPYVTLYKLSQGSVTLRITSTWETLYTLIPKKQNPAKLSPHLMQVCTQWGVSSICKNKVCHSSCLLPSLNMIQCYQITRTKTGGKKNNPESFKSSTQYSLSLSFKVLYNLINRIKVIGQNRAKRVSFHIFCFSLHSAY